MESHQRISRVLQLITLLRARPSKAIRHLAQALNTSDRTIYRYLDTLRSLGFNITQDEFMRFSIAQTQDTIPSPFSDAELKLIRSAVFTVPDSHPLKERILAKLGDPIGLSVNSELLLKTHLGHAYDALYNAMENRFCVVLKNYQSIHSGEVRDREVEPIDFTPDYKCIVAYEAAVDRTNYYNLERIESVVTLMESFKHVDKHQFATPDIFGFNGTNDVSYSIHLELTPKGRLLLINDFPSAEAAINITSSEKKLHLKADVKSLIPVVRFVRGLPNEVKVLGDQALIDELNTAN
jgi:predicted DNA-binding transcriptional regulator YafY